MLLYSRKNTNIHIALKNVGNPVHEYRAPNPIIRLKNFVRCQKQIVNVLLFFSVITDVKINCSLHTTQSQENLRGSLD